MRRRVLPAGAGAVIVLAAALAAAYWAWGGNASATSDGQMLQTADGAAGCLIDSGSVTCSNATAQGRSRPVALEAGGTTSPHARLATLDWSGAPVLQAGERRTFGSVRCVALSTQLACYAKDGSGIAVGAKQMSAVSAGAQYP
jgi:hypothetical protein